MLQPIDTVAGFDVRPGFYEMNGAFAMQKAVNFTIHSRGAYSCELLLFHREEEKPYAVIPFPENYRIGDVWSMIVFDLDIQEFEYAYRLDGPNNPARGMLFDRKRVLLDIYARAVTGQSVWGKRSKHFYKARVVQNNFDWGTEPRPKHAMEDLVIYELHVRGFTKHPSSGVGAPGTFRGVMEKIPYLKELGVNAVELMPVFEFDEMQAAREVNGKTLIDYWGYNPVCLFAPNTSYAWEKEFNHEGTELKELIRELNRNGIECFLDVVFNHTAEGDETGPIFSFKGFDNNIYYMMTPDGRYYNFSGCGNTLNCSHPVVRAMILECLRYWTTEYHVNGFRFDLATILGRDENGKPLSNPPLLESLAGDPILQDVKLIAEAWDAGGLYQVGKFPNWRRWAEWNGRYRDDLREYLKGGIWAADTAAQRIMGSRDLYDPKERGTNASVNFLNCHDGFTLWDMYSYNEKHNEANGWDNTDGADDNRSWNCGVEGETDDKDVLELRRRLCRNAMAVLMMSRGTAMFFAGDEFLNSQGGNNNAYCQDNEISWLNWDDLTKNRDQFEFTRAMIELRHRHNCIRKASGFCSLGFPEMSADPALDRTTVMQVLYAGRDQHGEDDAVCLLINPYWKSQTVRLPELPAGYFWRMEADTSLRFLPKGFREKRQRRQFQGRIALSPRSVMIFSLYSTRRSGR